MRLLEEIDDGAADAGGINREPHPAVLGDAGESLPHLGHERWIADPAPSFRVAHLEHRLAAAAGALADDERREVAKLREVETGAEILRHADSSNKGSMVLSKAAAIASSP